MGAFQGWSLTACDVWEEEIKRWNEEVKEALPRRNDAHKVMFQKNTEENKRRYKSMKNKVKKAVSKTMREKAEDALTVLQNYQNGMHRLVKGLNTDSKEVEGGRCMRGSDGKDHE